MDPATEAAAATRRRTLRAIAALTLLFFFLAAIGQLLPKSLLAEHALSGEKRVKAILAGPASQIGTYAATPPTLTWGDSNSAAKTSSDCSVHTYWPTGRLATNEYADGSVMSFGYDPNGNLTRRTKRDGSEILYTYDARNRLRITTLESGRQIFTGYNAAGLLESVRDTDTGQITYGNDLAQRVTTTTKANGAVIDYGFDPAGRVNSLSVGGRSQSWTYDPAGRTATATDFTGQTSTLGYDTAGRLASLTRPGAAGTTAISYDDAGRIRRVNSGAALGDFEYDVDAVGNRTAMTETLAGFSDTVDYQYDPLNRLAKESRRSGTVNEFEYDAVGNRTRATGQPDREYNEVDEVIGWDYDENGNLLADDEATYSFDELDRLTSATKSGYASSFTWDPEGNLLDQTQNGVTRSLVVDSQSGLARVLEERDPADNTVTASYSYCSANCTKVMSVENSDGHRWTHTDALGSMRTLGDDAGAVTDAKTFDAYGTPGPFNTGTNPNPYRFAGERTDASGLQWLRARWYGPKQGGFLSRDPATTIAYAYADGNPVQRTDPSGLFTLGDVGVAQSARTVVETKRHSAVATAAIAMLLTQLGRYQATSEDNRRRRSGCAVIGEEGIDQNFDPTSRTAKYRLECDHYREAAHTAGRDFYLRLAANAAWVEYHISQNHKIYDIGPDLGRREYRAGFGNTPESPFYLAERGMIRKHMYLGYIWEPKPGSLGNGPAGQEYHAITGSKD